jgi:diguanylate cyclase (GGDEF)-like protein
MSLQQILEERLLSAVFQPVIDLKAATIIGYEGLIRGPGGTALHSPLALFDAAKHYNVIFEAEQQCRETVLKNFARLNLPGSLFINVNPASLIGSPSGEAEILSDTERAGISPDRIIIELTETYSVSNFEVIRDALVRYRSAGFQIAIDDLGEGFSSLRLWSELRPEFVKVDKHFISGINSDPLKLQFTRSIQHIAECCGTKTIAEGIETASECLIVRDLGIDFGQGYFVARPDSNPPRNLAAATRQVIGTPHQPLFPNFAHNAHNRETTQKLLTESACVSPDENNDKVYSIFEHAPDLYTVAVVNEGVPVGLITRHNFITLFARPYYRELYGKKPCTLLMDPAPILVEKDLSLEELSGRMVNAERRHLADGFIITDRGKYLGTGTVQHLMRELTNLKIEAARYANPLTLLPGNVPIAQHIDELLNSGTWFCACYGDLNNFKPFNDTYGYSKGDDMIKLVGHALSLVCDADRDFIGHIGGDDFILIMRSEDWQERCERALHRFDEASVALFSIKDLEHGAFVGKNRTGRKVVFPLTKLAIGAVIVEPWVYQSHHEVAEAAAQAKKQAKMMQGSALFVERRKPFPA